MSSSNDQEPPRISAIVVHWRSEDDVAQLIAEWPEDCRFELLVVDNSSSLGSLPKGARVLRPAANLGFAGGVNRGVQEARAPWVLVLNPDIRLHRGALDRLLLAIEEFTGAAGVVPALEGPHGELQCRWQLQPLPSPTTLLLQTLFLAGLRGPASEPERGSAIEQPAAAALALRRSVLLEIGGMDEGFYPAWFEDVDLALRLRAAGHELIYDPRVRLIHGQGGSVSELGYGPFLWIYYRNLSRYLKQHHGSFWAAIARLLLPAGMALRIALLPLRRPRRAASRQAAVAALTDVIRGALSGWRRPESYARELTASPDRSPSR